MLGCVSRHQVYVGNESQKPVKELPRERQSKREGLAYNLVLEKVVAILRVCVCVCIWCFTVYNILSQTLETFLQQFYERVVGV